MPDGTDEHPPTPTPFRSAEDWLARRGVAREPLRVTPPPAGAPPAPADDGRTPVSAKEAARLATEAPGAAPVAAGADEPDDLGDLLAAAMAYARRATANTPMSERRLRDRLADRDHPQVVIDRALAQCRAERLVDDRAYATAFAEERRAKGHAPLRIRTDLERRGIPADVIDAVLAAFEAEDPEAQAFEIAQRKARGMRGVAAETAFRRLVGHLARRGFTDSLSRKVARQVVFADREDERIAGH